MRNLTKTRSAQFAAAIVVAGVIVGLGLAKSEQHISKIARAEQKAKTESQQQALKVTVDQIEGLKKQKSELVKKSNSILKELPTVLSQSDGALKLAMQFRNLAAKEKNQSKKIELQQRSEKAQKVANEKGQELMEKRVELYALLQQSAELDKQTKKLLAQKAQTEKLAKAESEKLQKLQPASQEKRIAAEEKKNM